MVGLSSYLRLPCCLLFPIVPVHVVHANSLAWFASSNSHIVGKMKDFCLRAARDGFTMCYKRGGISTLHTWPLRALPKFLSESLPKSLFPLANKTIIREKCYVHPISSHYRPISLLIRVMPVELPNGFRYSWLPSSSARYSTKPYVVEPAETLKPQKTGQRLSRIQVSENKSQTTLMYLLALVVAMVGCTYASVPLYRRFCQATGYGGTVRRRETIEEKIARHALEDSIAAREVVVQFNADVADGMPWRFTPTQREVRVKPGQSTLAFYTAENLSSKPITGVSTYNVTPMKVGIYFNKIQCFCFEEQSLLPGEKIDMPVFFYIDPEFATDPKMNDINSLILSYTFFKVDDVD